MVIAIVTGNDGTKYYYYGPFASALDAEAWSLKYVSGFKTQWAEVHNVQEYGSQMVEKEED